MIGPPEELSSFTIHLETPADIGHPIYVVRSYRIGDEGLLAKEGFAILVRSLDEARELIPAGCECVPRDPLDDPQLVETWF